jgi:hypothetical protein
MGRLRFAVAVSFIRSTYAFTLSYCASLCGQIALSYCTDAVRRVASCDSKNTSNSSSSVTFVLSNRIFSASVFPSPAHTDAYVTALLLLFKFVSFSAPAYPTVTSTTPGTD